ncbi:28S ribosomal protein S10, mitochondrial-like isoform X2 [Patiria miniata]|uniref:Small ribosomal subunit protein uS10m n=1 Tax=Patiria miniata TaxID=46514 RepID=A0A914B9V5_PATMI|nr:28S ribosomal protein S10, mitochondrial-like isoform X2 [Patiria miniata]
MAASMSALNVFCSLRKTSRIFHQSCHPALVLGLSTWCNFFQNNLSSTLHSRLYCTGQKSHLNNLPLPGSYCQTFHRALSTPTHQKASESTISEDKEEEELDTLYKSIELNVKGHDEAVLDSYEAFVSMAAKELGVTVQSISKPLRKIQRLTLLKSRHIYKKHRVQYEMRTHFRIIELKHVTGSSADVFLEYVERHLPEGVALKVTKSALGKMPDHLKSPPEEGNESSSSTSASSSSSSSSSEDEEDEHLR